MPNWCFNRLVVRGPAPEVRDFRERARAVPLAQRDYDELARRLSDGAGETSESALSFHAIVPQPEGVAGSRREGDWNMINWGVRGEDPDADVDAVGEDWVEYRMDTPWGPPDEFVEQAAELYPLLSFTLHYMEQGNDAYGTSGWSGGEAFQQDWGVVGRRAEFAADIMGMPLDEADEDEVPDATLDMPDSLDAPEPDMSDILLEMRGARTAREGRALVRRLVQAHGPARALGAAVRHLPRMDAWTLDAALEHPDVRACLPQARGWTSGAARRAAAWAEALLLEPHAGEQESGRGQNDGDIPAGIRALVALGRDGTEARSVRDARRHDRDVHAATRLLARFVERGEIAGVDDIARRLLERARVLDGREGKRATALREEIASVLVRWDSLAPDALGLLLSETEQGEIGSLLRERLLCHPSLSREDATQHGPLSSSPLTKLHLLERAAQRGWLDVATRMLEHEGGVMEDVVLAALRGKEAAVGLMSVLAGHAPGVALTLLDEMDERLAQRIRSEDLAPLLSHPSGAMRQRAVVLIHRVGDSGEHPPPTRRRRDTP